MNDIDSICFVSPGVYNYLKPGMREGGGGAERQQYLIGKELLDRGYDVSFIIRRYDEPYCEEIDGFSVWKGIPESTGVTATPRRFFELYRAMQRCDADIYYFRGNPLQVIIGSYCCLLTKKPYIYAVANDKNVDPDLNNHYRLLRWLYINSIKNATIVLSQTNHQKVLLKEHYKIDSTVLPNGYTTPSQERLISCEDREYVLWVGSLHKDQKRPDRFLDIAQQLPDIEFVMIATPSNDEEWNDRIRTNAREVHNLQYEGFVPPDEIGKYYQKASIVVNTSNYEGFPNVFLEAWAYAIPVVTLNYSMDGFIEKHSCGIHSGSMDQIVQDIRDLSFNLKLRERLGNNGRQLVKNEFSIESITDKILTEIETALTN